MSTTTQKPATKQRGRPQRRTSDEALTAELAELSARIREQQQALRALEEPRNRLVKRAIAKGWTHAQIAEATGLTRGRIGQIATAGPMMTAQDRVPAPDGLRWATGGGSPQGDCNGWHLADSRITGTLCGRYGPHTPNDPESGTEICGSCARIAKIPKRLKRPTKPVR